MNLFQIIGYPLYLVATLEIILGFILLRQPSRRSPVIKAVAAFSFFLSAFALFTAIMYTRASMGLDFNFFTRATWIGWFSIPAALQFIFYMKDETGRVARRIGFVLYPFWLILFVLCLFTDLVEPGHVRLIPYEGQAGPLEDPARFFGALLILWIVYEIFMLRKSVGGVRKVQLNYFFIGTLIFGASGAFMVGLLQLFGGIGFDPALGAYFSLPWVALTFYAITRYRMFDIRIVISQTLTIALLALFFSAIHIALFTVFEPIVGPKFTILISLFIIAFIFFGTQLNSKVQAWVQKVILRGKYHYQNVLMESTKAIVTMLDRDELLDYIVTSIRKSLAVENIGLHIRDHDDQYVLRHGFNIEGNPVLKRLVNTNVVPMMQHSKQVAIREELEVTQKTSDFGTFSAHMKAIQAEIIVPIFFKGELQGLLTLGEKGNREPYVQSDIDLLETLASHTAVAIENARLYEEAGQVKESLRESEKRFRNLVETMSDWVWEVDINGVYSYVSPKIQDILGYAPEEVLGKTPVDFMAKEDAERAAKHIMSAATSKQAFRLFENKNLHKNGHLVVIESNGVPIYDKSGAFIGYRGINRDVTERKKLEDQLRYAQKMEAIGKLAGGVAHDFNNILTAIIGYGYVLHMKMAKADPLRKHVDQILSSTERATNLTQSLLAFGKKKVYTLEPTAVNEMIQRMEKLLYGFIREDIELKLKLADTIPNVMADVGHVERIIMNLAVNARDAMPKGGRLTIETGVEELDSEFVKAHGYGSVGSYAFFSMTDTGVGMDTEVKKRIFEPFFTTKSLGKGTGFGLSIAYGIVKEHNGYITVDSTLGKGTTFKVYLPFEETGSLGTMLETVPIEREGTETLLVADDDEGVRKFTRGVFEGFGYTVVTAKDGEEAVKKFKASKGGIDLLILDVIMPNMNGKETYEAIREIQPGIRALFASGYNEEVIQKKGLLDDGSNFILKPTSPKELLKQVRAILDQ